MAGKIQIQAGVNLMTGASEVAKLQKQLDLMASKLKLNVKQVSLAGQQLSSGSSNVATGVQKTAQQTTNYEKSLNKLLVAQKKKQIADEDLVKRLNTAISMGKFKELSDKKQIQTINALARAEKNLDNIRKMSKASTSASTQKVNETAVFKQRMYDQKQNELNAAHKEALAINKQVDAQKAKEKQANAQRISDKIIFNQRMHEQRQKEINDAHKEALAINKELEAQRAKEKQINAQRISDKIIFNQKMHEQRQREIDSAHKEALAINKAMNTERQRVSNLNAQRSNVRIFDAPQQQLVQSGLAGRLDGLTSKFTSMQSDPNFSKLVNVQQLTQMNQQFQTLQNTMSRISNNKMLQQWNTDFNRVNNQLTNVNRQMNTLNSGGYRMGEMLTQGIKKMLIWSVAATAIYAPFRAFQRGLQTLKEIDTALVNIEKVTNRTKEEMQDLAKSAADVGVAFGRTAQEYLSAVTEFSRAGYGKSAEELGKTSLLLQNVGDVNSEVANSFLLATDAAYKLGGSQEKLTNVINGLNNVSNKNATTVSKLSDGMSVSASIAEQAGVRIEELSGAISTMTIVTQRSGSEAGRAFRGILMNLRQIKGETEDGDIIDEEAMGKSEKVLANVGIGIREVRNGIVELRDPMKILEELATKWKDLSSEKQAPIIDALGGKYRGNQLVALLERWDIYQKTVKEYINNNNSAIRENIIYMNSWEAKTKQLSAAMSRFWLESLNTDLVKGFLDSIRSIVEVLTEFGGVVPIITALITTMIVSSFMKAGMAVDGFNVKLAMTNVLMGGIPILIGLVVGGITGYIMHTDKATDTTEQFNDALYGSTRGFRELKDEQEQYNKQAQDYNLKQQGQIELASRLTDELDELSKKVNKTTAEKIQMENIVDKLNSLIPNLNLSIDAETGLLNTQTGAIRDQILAYKDLVKVKAAEKMAEGAAQRKLEAELNQEKAKKEKANIQNKIKETSKGYVGYKPSNSPIDTAKNFVQGVSQLGQGFEVSKLQAQMNEQENIISENQKIINDADELINKMGEESYKYAEKYGKTIKQAEGNTSGNVITPNGGSSSKSETELYMAEAEALMEYKNAIEDVNDALQVNESLLSRVENDKDKIPLIEKKIELLKEQKKAYSELANQNRELIKSKLSKLGNYGVDFNLAYDPKFNKLLYDKSKINNIYGKDIESTNELRKSAEGLLDEIESLNNENKSLGSNWFSTDKEIVSSTKEVRDLLKKINDEAAKAIQDDASKRLETYENAQDKIADLLKKKYEQQKKDEEKALDDSLEKYKEYVDEKIKQIDREKDAANYKDDIDDMNKKIMELQHKKNALTPAALSGDVEAMAKVKELDKDIEEATTDKKRKQRNRGFDLRTEALQGLSEKKEKDTKEAKEQVDIKYEKLLDENNLKLEAQTILLDKNVNRATESIKSLFTTTGENATKLGELIQTELINKLPELNKSVRELTNLTKMSSDETSKVAPQLKSQGYDVNYNSASKSIDVYKDGYKGSIPDGTFENKDGYNMGNPSQVQAALNSATFVPETKFPIADKLRELGFKVTWNPANGEITLEKDGKTGIIPKGTFPIENSRSMGTRSELKDELTYLGFPIPAGFKTGGINDIPGLYPLHGTKSSPEVIFNSGDAKKLFDFVQSSTSITEKLGLNKLINARIPQVAGASNINLNFDSLVNIQGDVTPDVMSDLSKVVSKASDMVIGKIKNELAKSGFIRR